MNLAFLKNWVSFTLMKTLKGNNIISKLQHTVYISKPISLLEKSGKELGFSFLEENIEEGLDCQDQMGLQCLEGPIVGEIDGVMVSP